MSYLAGVPALMGGNCTLSTISLTLTGNNETKVQNLFQITESVLLHAIWGEVTTALGSNLTAVNFIPTSAGGSGSGMYANATLSSFVVGAMIFPYGIGNTGTRTLNPSVRALSGSTFNSGDNFLGLTQILTQQTASVASYLALTYATTNTPTSGVIKFRALWEKITANGSLA